LLRGGSPKAVCGSLWAQGGGGHAEAKLSITLRSVDGPSGGPGAIWLAACSKVRMSAPRPAFATAVRHQGGITGLPWYSNRNEMGPLGGGRSAVLCRPDQAWCRVGIPSGDLELASVDIGRKSAQRAGIDHSRMVKRNAYLGRKPSYDPATFARIRLALDSANPPSLSAIAKAERLSKQTVLRLKQDPQAALAALEAWGM
jgi:hypothetical protein